VPIPRDAAQKQHFCSPAVFTAERRAKSGHGGEQLGINGHDPPSKVATDKISRIREVYQSSNPDLRANVLTAAAQRGAFYALRIGGKTSIFVTRSLTTLASGGNRGNDSKRPWHFEQFQRCRIS
jgi:hypothetical protein